MPPLTKPYARLLDQQGHKLFWHAFETAKKMGWTIVDYSEKDGRIEATDRSFWFGQTADIVIRVQTAGALGARLDIRSQSEQRRARFRQQHRAADRLSQGALSSDSARRPAPRGRLPSYAPDAPAPSVPPP